MVGPRVRAGQLQLQPNCNWTGLESDREGVGVVWPLRWRWRWRGVLWARVSMMVMEGKARVHVRLAIWRGDVWRGLGALVLHRMSTCMHIC